MTGRQVAVVIVCFVAILLVAAWVIGPRAYEVPADIRPVRTVSPMTVPEVWGN